jgi:hypothetical protein
LTPQWINSDGSAPATTLVYIAGEREYHRTSPDAFTDAFAEAFGFVGDLAAFTSSYGPAGAVVVSFLYYAYLYPNFHLIPLRRHSLSYLLSKNRHLKLSVSRPHDARLFQRTLPSNGLGHLDLDFTSSNCYVIKDPIERGGNPTDPSVFPTECLC